MGMADETGWPPPSRFDTPIALVVWCALGAALVWLGQPQHLGLARVAFPSVCLVTPFLVTRPRQHQKLSLGGIAFRSSHSSPDEPRPREHRGPRGNGPPSLVRHPRTRRPSDRTSAATVEEPRDDGICVHVRAASTGRQSGSLSITR